MASYRLLRTTIDDYEVINFDSAMAAAFLRNQDVTSQIDGMTAVFTTTDAIPYMATTLSVFLGGVLQPVTETSPAGGTFTLDGVPDGDSGTLEIIFVAA